MVTDMNVALNEAITEEFTETLAPTMRLIGLETPTQEGKITWEAWRSSGKTGTYGQIARGVCNTDLFADPDAVSLSRVRTGRVKWPKVHGTLQGKPMVGATIDFSARMAADVEVQCTGPKCKLPDFMPLYLWQKKCKSGEHTCSKCGTHLRKVGIVQPPLEDGLAFAIQDAMMDEEAEFRFPTYVGVFDAGTQPVEPALDWLEEEVQSRMGSQHVVVPMRQLREAFQAGNAWVEPIVGLRAVFGVSHRYVAGWLPEGAEEYNQERESFKGFLGEPFYERQPNHRKGGAKKKKFISAV